MTDMIATPTMIERANDLLRRGIVPIPLHGKIPRLSGWQKLSTSTVNPATIQQWHDEGLLKNIGVLCGAASGNLLVFDFDGLDGYKTYCAQFPILSETLTVATGSGNGMHVYYRAETLPKSTGQLAVPGGHVEIKADGRQVVAPPSVHPDTGALYEVYKRIDIHPLPSGDMQTILDWIAKHNEPERTYTPEPQAPSTNGTAHRAYAEAALTNETNLLATMPSGGRNDQLTVAAFSLGQIVAAGHLTRDEVKRALLGACQANNLIKDDGVKTFEATFESGLRAGMGQPRYIPDRPMPRPLLPGQPAYVPPPMKVPTDIVTIGQTRIIKRTSLFEDLARRINDDQYVPPVPPIPFPLKCLHFLGGQARVTKVGKVCALVGASGSGKTSALETLADHYVQQGTPVCIWTPEWTPDEMAERAVQRYGGPSQDELYAHEIAKWRAQQGLEFELRDYLTIAQREEANKALAHIMLWETEVNYMENTTLNMTAMAEIIQAMRETVKPFPRVFIVDYIQLLKSNEADTDDSSMYNLIQRFKSLCVYYGLIGWVATQTVKEDARRNIKQGEFMGTTVLNCTKNSRGRKGKVRVKYDADRLRIGDTAHPNQIFNDESYWLGSQAGRWVNDDAFNLWVTLNPEYEENSQTAEF